MAGNKADSVNALVKLGVKYGPVVYEAVKRGKEPARQMAERQASRTSSRRKALEHAHHLVDGSVLTVFDGDERLFVVFNGDEPIASHPASAKPLASLIRGYDLDKRVRATRTGRIMPRVKQVGPVRAPGQVAPQAAAPAPRPTQGPAGE